MAHLKPGEVYYIGFFREKSQIKKAAILIKNILDLDELEKSRTNYFPVRPIITMNDDCFFVNVENFLELFYSWEKEENNPAKEKMKIILDNSVCFDRKGFTKNALLFMEKYGISPGENLYPKKLHYLAGDTIKCNEFDLFRKGTDFVLYGHDAVDRVINELSIENIYLCHIEKKLLEILAGVK